MSWNYHCLPERLCDTMTSDWRYNFPTFAMSGKMPMLGRPGAIGEKQGLRRR
jgi:hypothetical protein